MGTEDVRGVRFVCDNEDCGDMVIVYAESGPYQGYVGTVDVPTGTKDYDEHEWVACSDDCVVPAVRAVKSRKGRT